MHRIKAKLKTKPMIPVEKLKVKVCTIRYIDNDDLFHFAICLWKKTLYIYNLHIKCK